MKKLQNLEGLRGIAALIVVLFHFIVSYFPVLVLPNSDYPNKLIEYIAKSPLNVFFNGLFSVSIFFVLSGFVLSYKFFKTEEVESIISTAFKRYIRLVIPVAFSILLIYLLMKINPENISSTIKDTGIFDVLYEGFIGCFLTPSNKYSPVVWTMYYELSGSFLVFGFCLIFYAKRNRIFGYIFLMIFFWGTHYFSFFAGILLSDLYVLYGNYIKSNIIKVVLLLIALFLGSYPTLFDQKTISTTIYSFMYFNSTKEIFIIYHSLGATLLLMVLMNSDKMNKLFSSKLLVSLGKISFSMYLIHMIVLTYFTKLFIIYIRNEYIHSPIISRVVAYILSLLLIFVFSFLMTKYIDRPGLKLANIIYDKMFRGYDRKIIDFNFQNFKNYFMILFNKTFIIKKE